MSWFVIAITIGLSILRQLIKPKVKRPRGQDLEGWFADEGRTIPQIYGTQSVSFNAVWWGDAFQHDGQDAPVTFYHARLIGTACMGPVAEIIDIHVGGKSLALEPITRAQSGSGTATSVVTPPLPQTFNDSNDPITLAIHARSLFGGLLREGGIEGEVRIYPGTPAQGIDPLSVLSTANEEIPDATARPGVCYIAIGGGHGAEAGGAREGDFYWGLSPNPKEWVLVLRTEYSALLELGLNAGYTSARIGANLNPGEMLFDLACHEIRGAGADPALIDVQSIADLAAILEDEQFGLSATLASPDEASDLLDEILRHIDGGRTEDPETGLVSFYLVRPDPEIVAEISDSNTDDLVVEEPNYRELTNDLQLTYRKWTGGVSGPVVNEVLTKNIQFLGLKNRYYQSKGRNISNVHAYADGVELTDLVDYDFDSVSGLFVFGDTAAISPGQTITISYTSLPMAMTLVEATAKDYDLADQQITEEVRSMTVDFPYITNELLAQVVARRTLRAFGLPLKLVTWTINRTGHKIRPGKAARINSARYGLTDFFVRILPPTDYGTLENGRIQVKAIEDVWGTAFLPLLPTGSGVSGVVPPTAPGMTISCGAGGTLVRIEFWVTDPTFDIELWRADDELGTGAVLVTTLPGSTAFWDDGTDDTKAHRARMVRPGFTDGAYTPWITCDLSGGDPEDPAVILPAVLEMPSQTETVGTLLLDITDPQHRVTLVEFKSKAGTETETAFLVDSAEPWTADVNLLFPATSSISYRVTYIGETGDLGTIEGMVVFGPPPVEPPPIPPSGDAPSRILLVPLHAALTHGSHIIGLPAALTPLHDYSLRGVPASDCARCRIQAHVTSPLPAGAYLAAQYVTRDNTSPAEEDWVFLDGVAGPTFPADAATGLPTWSAWTDLDLLARQDIVIRGVCVGGDEVTPLGLKEMFVELDGEVLNNGGDSTEPDPCQDSTNNFDGYETGVEFLEDWSVEENDMAGAAISLDLTGGVGGSRCGKLTVPGGADNTHVGAVAVFLLTGLAPSTMHTITGQIKTDWEITGGFGNDGPVLLGLRYPGDEASTVLEYATSAAFNQWEELTASHFSNGSGELEIVFGFGSGIGSLEATRAIRCDDIVVTGAGGIVVNPCSGGPTIGGPGDPPVPNDPPPPPAPGSQRLILWNYFAPWTAFTPFAGTVFNVYVSRIIADLTAMRAAGIRAVLTLVPHGRALRNGRLDQATYMAYLETTAGLPLDDYDDVIIGIMVIDEPQCASCWGGASMQWSVVDGVLAKRTFELFPNYPRFVRATGTLIEQSGIMPRYITHSWNQYTYSGRRTYGTVQNFMAAQKAASQRLGLGWMWGGNAAVGGPTGGNITPATILQDYVPMARDPDSMGLAIWAGGPPPYSFLQGTSYRAAFDQVVAAFPT